MVGNFVGSKVGCEVVGETVGEMVGLVGAPVSDGHINVPLEYS